MAKWAHDDVLDAPLHEIAEADKLIVCSDQPADYTEATDTYLLASVDLTPGDGNGDWTIGDGDATGRKLTLAAQTIASAAETGTATHLAVVDSANSKLLAVKTLGSNFAVTSGNSQTVPANNWSMPDPV